MIIIVIKGQSIQEQYVIQSLMSTETYGWRLHCTCNTCTNIDNKTAIPVYEQLFISKVY